MNRILIISHGEVKEQMAGPAIRCWEFARTLAPHLPVTLATPNPIPEIFQTQTAAICQSYDSNSLPELARNHDILLLQGFLLEQYPVLQHLDKIVIVDLYDPFPLESLENPQEVEHALQWQRHLNNIHVLNRQITLADYMICASERQKDYWLGYLTALNRINPSTYQQGNYDHLLGVVPFGIPEKPMQIRTNRLRGAKAGYGISEKDFVLLWGGGIWDWLDPLTPIRAVAQLVKAGASVKLFFLGLTSPDPNIPQMQMGQKAISLAQELGVYGTHVIFNQKWIPYEQRQYFLKGADVGISSHFEHLETRFSFRTRALDYFWAQLPLITTCGDTVADWVERFDTGNVVGYQSVDDWIQAIQALQRPAVYKKKQKGGDQLREQLKWSVAVQPLMAFCQNPTPAADRGQRNKIKQSLVLHHFPKLRYLSEKWETYGTLGLFKKIGQRALKRLQF